MKLHVDSKIAVMAGWFCLLLIGGFVYCSPRWFFLSSNDVIWLRIMQSKPPLALAWEQFVVGSPLDYRPLATVYFLALQGLFGDWAPGYYAFSLLLHAINALLVFLVARIFRLSWQAAAFAALLFVIHPAPVRAVRWVNDAANLLQTLFLMSSLLLAWRFLETEVRRFYWLSLACAAAAVFSKESGIVALVLPFVLDLCLRGLRPLKRFARYAPHGLVAAFYLYLYVSIAHSPGWRSHPEVFGLGSHVPTKSGLQCRFRLAGAGRSFAASVELPCGSGRDIPVRGRDRLSRPQAGNLCAVVVAAGSFADGPFPNDRRTRLNRKIRVFFPASSATGSGGVGRPSRSGTTAVPLEKSVCSCGPPAGGLRDGSADTPTRCGAV